MAKESFQFTSLPTEIVLHVLSFLDPPSLARCGQVCKQWQADDKIWLQLERQRGYINERLDDDAFNKQEAFREISPASSHCILQPLPDEIHDQISSLYDPEIHGNAGTELWEPIYRSDSSGYFGSSESCQDSCKKKWCLDRAWQCEPGGRLAPHMRSLNAAPPYVGQGLDAHEEVGGDVWRIKIDPTERVMISSGRRGGVRVVDLKSGQVLWRIPRNLTRHFPHVEYDRRILIFDRIGHGHLEIWKQPRLGDPEDLQSSGTFTFATSLPSPRPTRAFRFQYPTLVVATQDGYVLIWDIETQKIIKEISLADSMHIDGNINYIDFDDVFIFVVGTGAKSFSVLSRKLGKVIWTLGDAFKGGIEELTTYTIASEPETDTPFEYASLERRKLRRAAPSPWQSVPGRQNFAQLTMAPFQRWSAVHPDFRSRTLVVLSHTNVLLIRDYLGYFLSWEKKLKDESHGKEGAVDVKALSPSLFVDLRFSEESPTLNELSTAQLAVAESRAMCIVSKPLLLDLDPLRLTRNDIRNIGIPIITPDREVGDFVSDAEAGFAVYDSISPPDHDSDDSDPYSATFDSCSCVAMDSTAIYAVQMHHEMQTGDDIHDVCIWDFAEAAKQRW